MTQPSSPDLASSPPDEPWRAECGTALLPGETLLAGLTLDLDATLHFTQGWLVVTDRRLIARTPGEGALQDWPISADLQLAHTDHAGVGTLELADASRLIARWRYTLGHNPAALRVADQFAARRDQLASRSPPPVDESVCPT